MLYTSYRQGEKIVDNNQRNIMITTLKIKFDNCYGIKSLSHAFDFSVKKVFSIYAPNGTMKTSFAKTCKDYSANKTTSDIIFPERVTIREIKNELDIDISAQQIFVIEPYLEKYKSDKLSTLLVNRALKDRYEEILEAIDKEKNNLISKLKQLSGLTSRGNPIENELSKVFGNKSFFDILLDLENFVAENTEHKFSAITYNKIFEEKVVAFLNTKDFKKQIQEYIERYNTLIESSKYLKKGFNHSNVSEIQKNLKSNGSFEAQHSVNLFNGTSNDIITSEVDLQEIISKEMETVLSDADIQKKFNDIDSKLSNAQLREFREYLFDNKDILPELSNLEKFKKDIWTSYFIDQKDLFNNLIEEYKKGREEIEAIIIHAKAEATDWKDVINIFNKRFSVPFKLEMRNQDDVILKSETPNLNFIFSDDDALHQEKNIEESELMKVLSQGERRALYILHIIFEVRARKNANQETIFIVDDIADSFDYKNKYAIIEYLKEISEEPLFYQIILTHNFDFHRTITSRLNMGRNNKLNTIRTTTGINLVTEKYQNNPFSYWKENLHTNSEMLIASIPFVRNIAEYSGQDNIFSNLTSLLHFKSNTSTITIAALETNLKTILIDKATLSLASPENLVIDVIYNSANIILGTVNQNIDLENKIVLAIAIRLKAEEFMVAKINDNVFWNGITTNQTYALIQRFKNDFTGETANIEILEQVNLMTPENIHLNSFMYEPILDMSNEHLKQLYQAVRDTLI